MDFTFGIITNGANDNNLNKIIDSINKNNIPNFEIIIVGNTTIQASDKITVSSFNETIKPAWITKKKNIIAKNAKYENVVLLHDYIIFDDNWYNGFLKFGNDFDWCVNKIVNCDGTRFRDYTFFPYKIPSMGMDYSPGDIDSYFNENCLLPYDFVNSIKTNKYLYVSGSYYVIKKKVALTHLLNEDLVWCQGEDLEFTKRLHDNGIIIKCNQFSTVKFLKQKNPEPWENEISDEKLQKFINFCNNS